MAESPTPKARNGLSRAKRWKLALLLALLAMVSPFSVDTYFPSFPAIAADFGLSKLAIQQTMTVYLLPLSIMSLVQGPLSDALGRRPVILVGLVIYTVASIGCTVAPNFATLLAFRSLQGASAGVGMIVGRAVIGDLFEGAQAQKLLSLVTMLFAFAPAAAPVIGGWIHVMLGWRAVFEFMTLYGALSCIAAYLMLPETHPKEYRPLLHVITLARTAGSIVKNVEFVLLAFSAGANFAAMLSFIGAAPAIVLDHWRLSETQFAYLFVPVISGLMGGALLSSRMAGRVTYAQQSRAGFVLALTGVGLMTLFDAIQDLPSVLLQQVMIGITALGAQMAGTVLILRMLDLFPMARGSAASVQSCVSIAISALVFGLLSPALSGSMLSLSEGSLLSALLALLLFHLAQHVSAQRTQLV